ncbi:hypothetical protein ACFQH8_06925 [Halomicroarcula sp. GCM10025710]
MVLPASTAVLALIDAPFGALTPSLVTESVPLTVALLVGALFGIVGALFGEVLQRVFYAHADTHLDPPAASIVVTSSSSPSSRWPASSSRRSGSRRRKPASGRPPRDLAAGAAEILTN